MGFTPFLIVAVDNVMIIAMNAILQRTGGADGDMLVTCNTIVQSFMLVVTMPLGGISGGTQGILGFNYGARQVDRVRQAQKYIVGLCVGYTTLLFVLARVAGPLFVRLFTKNPVLAQEGPSRPLKSAPLAIIPLGVQYELVDGFTGIGQVRLSLPLSFWRKLVYFVAIFALPAALWSPGRLLRRAPVRHYGPGRDHRGLLPGHGEDSAGTGRDRPGQFAPWGSWSPVGTVQDRPSRQARLVSYAHACLERPSATAALWPAICRLIMKKPKK